MIQTVVAAVITFFAGLVAGLLGRLRFDEIAVDEVPAMQGALALYRDAVHGFGVRIKVVNGRPSPVAIEWIAAFLPLKPRPGGPRVHAAFGECWPQLVEDGPRGSSLTEEIYPIVVPAGGGQLFLELRVAMQYYRKVFPIWPYYWKDLGSLGIDDPNAPAGPSGESMYHDYFEVGPPHLRLQISGKMRTLPVRTRGWWGVLPRARLPGIVTPRSTEPPIPLPPEDDESSQ